MGEGDGSAVGRPIVHGGYVGHPYRKVTLRESAGIACAPDREQIQMVLSHVLAHHPRVTVVVPGVWVVRNLRGDRREGDPLTIGRPLEAGDARRRVGELLRLPAVDAD